MSDTPLPTSGPGREIFLRALREYSEQCEEPFLTPGCPFAVATRTGRGCLEECQDLLALYEAPPPFEDLRFGEISIVRRRRPRSRRPTQARKPFDARESRLGENSDDVALWKTPSVVYELHTSVCETPCKDGAPADGRREKISVCSTVLAGRGIDVELLIREGLAAFISAQIGLTVVLPLILERQGVAVGPLPVPPAGWREALLPEGKAPSGPPDIPFRHLESWVRAAPFDDLIDWRAPTREDLLSLGPRNDDGGGLHRWLADRCLGTYLQSWATESLRLEWKYLHGMAVAPCPSSEMAFRNIDENELAKTIADRDAGRTSRRRQPSLERFTLRAVELLNQGDFGEAAAVFEAMTEVAPDHAEAWNNYGFCLLPGRPSEALSALERAASLGFETIPVNVGNRLLALACLERITSALEFAESSYDTLREQRPWPGWLWAWQPDDPSWKLVEVDDVRLHTVDLAAKVAERTGDAALTAVWRSRRSEIAGIS